MTQKKQGVLWAAIWLAFVAFTVAVTLQAPEGMMDYFGNLPVLSWGGQVMMDLVMMALVALTLLVPDARRRGVSTAGCTALVVATLFLGSLVPLAYMAWRGLAAPKG